MQTRRNGKSSVIWAKTDAGRAEMQARALVKERAQRNLLLLIDGIKSEEMLLANLAGITADDFTALRRMGLIAPVAGAPAGRGGRSAAAAPAAAARGARRARRARLRAVHRRADAAHLQGARTARLHADARGREGRHDRGAARRGQAHARADPRPQGRAAPPNQRDAPCTAAEARERWRAAARWPSSARCTRSCARSLPTLNEPHHVVSRRPALPRRPHGRPSGRARRCRASARSRRRSPHRCCSPSSTSVRIVLTGIAAGIGRGVRGRRRGRRAAARAARHGRIAAVSALRGAADRRLALRCRCRPEPMRWPRPRCAAWRMPASCSARPTWPTSTSTAPPCTKGCWPAATASSPPPPKAEALAQLPARGARGRDGRRGAGAGLHRLRPAVRRAAHRSPTAPTTTRTST